MTPTHDFAFRIDGIGNQVEVFGVNQFNWPTRCGAGVGKRSFVMLVNPGLWQFRACHASVKTTISTFDDICPSAAHRAGLARSCVWRTLRGSQGLAPQGEGVLGVPHAKVIVDRSSLPHAEVHRKAMPRSIG